MNKKNNIKNEYKYRYKHINKDDYKEKRDQVLFLSQKYKY